MPEEKDLLTDAIFSALEEGEGVFVRRDEEDVLTQAIFARLDSSSRRDRDRFDLPAARQANLDKRPAKEKPKIILSRESVLAEIEGFDPAELIELEDSIIIKPLPGKSLTDEEKPKPELVSTRSKEEVEIEIVKAQEDWFQVRTADLSARLDSPVVKQTLRPLLKAEYKEESSRAGWAKKIILSGFLLVIIGGGLFYFLDRFDTNFFSFERNNFLGSQSFVLVNAEEDMTFKPLFLLRKNIEEIQQELFLKAGKVERNQVDSIEKLDKLAAVIDEFFKANENFSWFNAFKSEEGIFSKKGFSSFPVEQELLAEVVNEKAFFEKETGLILKPSNAELYGYLDWLGFWQNLFGQSGEYLVLSTHPYHESPVGGEPLNYSLVKMEEGKVKTIFSGKVEELNAALIAKTIPPQPIQAVKTNFDLLEAGWFLSTSQASRFFSELFESTAGRSVDGVIWVEYGLIEEIVRKQGFAFSPESPRWFEDFAYGLARRSSVNWQGLEGTLESALKDGRLKLYFEKSPLSDFVQKNNLSNQTNVNSSEDALSFGLRSWGEGRFSIELLEYWPEFFVDGSIVSQVTLDLRNSGEDDTAYAKIYLPAGSIVLGEKGFSFKKEIPGFDYKARGFTVSSLVVEESGKGQLDFFREGELLAVGGWVDIPAGARKTISLNYRLPFRLDWQKGEDTYKLNILKPGREESLPLRWRTDVGEKISFEWLQPQGFLSDNLAEYQTVLREDTILKAKMKFKKD